MMESATLLELARYALILGAVGAVGGVVAGLLGVGGGIIVVPALYQVFGLLGYDDSVRMHLAVGTSLATLAPTAVVSARAHWKRGGVDAAALKQMAPGLLFGVALGGAAASVLRGPILTLVFASVALAIALFMGVSKEGTKLRDGLPPSPWRDALTTLIGGISVLMGIGGGTLGTSTLSLCGYPLKRAVGTAAAMGPIIGFPGAILFAWGGIDVPGRPPLSLGYVSLLGFILIAPAQTWCAPYGAKLAHAMPAKWLRATFALFLIVTSGKLFYAVLG